MAIKNFIQFHESNALQPHVSVLELIELIKNTRFKDDTDFNTAAKPFNVKLVKYEDFIKYLTARGDDPKTFPPNRVPALAYTDPINNKIFLVYNKRFFYNINEMLQEFIKMLRHEGVHRSQVDKYVEHDIKETDVSNTVEYLSHPREIMAMARTIVDELKEHPRELEYFKKTKRINNKICPTLDFYKHNFANDDAVYKRLMKYVYQYLTSEG